MNDYECPFDCDPSWDPCPCRCHELDGLLEIERQMDLLLDEHDGETYSHEVIVQIIVAKNNLATAIRAHDATIRMQPV